ncbi:hypothetical protein ACH5RR_003026 [Cinchona calisaya]|uniref:RNase H type-1 domain-containing protein n=1 Tax=Cinchona calisaya TaxID=153742 RepID=A0ABD3ATM3_9GENT
MSSEETFSLNYGKEVYRISSANIFFEIGTAMDKVSKRLGYSLMARDRNGKLLKILVDDREGKTGLMLMMAEAMRPALVLAKEEGWDRVQLFCSNKAIVEKLNKKTTEDVNLATFLEDILN